MPERSTYPDLKIQVEHNDRFLVFEAEWRDHHWVCEDERWVIRLWPDGGVGGVELGGHLFKWHSRKLHSKVRDALVHEARQMIKGDHHAYRD